ncbi:NAD-dependent deacylase [Candidatus Thorarchaeota archaeon]|nr:NAD-dependent deacylase [Candidatus Thorarchaeota archaeon]TFG98801.1 MAG: NAD-dependent deacylase [Candidatus Thorarchaeota archaeon]
MENKMFLENELMKAKEMVRNAEKILALTGAGISVDSGIPDFRSEGGLWKRFDPLEYATLESFTRDPTKFWTMGKELAETMVKAKPNDAHLALAKLEQQGKLTGVITLNIDNLHQSAGNKRVIELHGNYLCAQCTECKTEYFGKTVHESVAKGEIPPKCEKCGGILKSEAILFGEPLPEVPMAQAVELCRTTDLMIVIGTSLTVYPAAFLPQLAKNAGAKIILINLEGINKDAVADTVLRGRATDILPMITEF